MSTYRAKCLTCGCQSAGTDPLSAQAVADCHAEACPGHVVAVTCDPSCSTWNTEPVQVSA